MKISSIHLNNMRNDAHFQFHTEFRDLVVQHNPETLKISPQLRHINRFTLGKTKPSKR